MDPVTFAKLWLLVKPVKRIRQWRTRKKLKSWHDEHGGPPDETLEDFNVSPDEVSMKSTFALQIVLAVLRHGMTALAPLGVTVSDDWLTQTAAIVVGLAGLAWSFARKAK